MNNAFDGFDDAKGELIGYEIEVVGATEVVVLCVSGVEMKRTGGGVGLFMFMRATPTLGFGKVLY